MIMCHVRSLLGCFWAECAKVQEMGKIKLPTHPVVTPTFPKRNQSNHSITSCQWTICFCGSWIRC
jgi:hypothetical protein